VKIPAALEEMLLHAVCLEKFMGQLISVLTNKEMMASYRPKILIEITS
jgi:hypothetical protein